MKSDAPLAPLEDACTVVLLRDGDGGLETLLLERPHASRSFAGAWVFPGGKVDPEDRLNGSGARHDDFMAAQLAGLREVAEETGQQLSREDLVWLSQWTPMQRIPRRFRTWFMLAAAASEAVVLNLEEHSNFAWLSPAEALARHARGGMLLVPPTWVTLHNLAAVGTVAQALAAARNSQPFAYNTHLLGPAGVVWFGDEEYPGSAGQPFPAARGTRPEQAPGQPGTQAPKQPAGQPGARHRLTMTGLPWVFERSGF